MHYLVCDRCGHHNNAQSPTLTFCEHCGHKLPRCFGAWQAQHPEQGIEDFWRTECITATEPPQTATNRAKHQRWPTWIAILVGAITLSAVVVLLALPIGQQAERLTGFSPDEIHFLSSDTSRWMAFCGNEGYFRVYIPKGDPQRIVNIASTEVGSIDVVMYQLEMLTQQHPNLVYMVAFSTYPPNFIINHVSTYRDLDALFEGAILSTIQGARAQLLSAYYSPLDDHPGRAIEAEISSNGSMLSARFYLINNTMFCLQVLTPAENYPNAAANFFFSSFEVLQAE